MGNYETETLTEKTEAAISGFLSGMRESGLLNQKCNYLRGHRDTKNTLCPGAKMMPFLENLQNWHKDCSSEFPNGPDQCPNYNGPGYHPSCTYTVFTGFCQSEELCTAEGGKKGLTVSFFSMG